MARAMINGRVVDLDDGVALLEAVSRMDMTDAERVAQALDDPRQTVALQLSRGDAAALARGVGLTAADAGRVLTALRRLGVDRVFDTGFAVDLSVMEMAAELLRRGASGTPLLTAGCARAVADVEARYPALLPYLSTCRTPQQMLGSLITNYYADAKSLPPDRVCSVAVSACPARRAEAARPAFQYHGMRDVDAVLTPAELADLLTARGIDPSTLPSEPFSAPFGLSGGLPGGLGPAVLRAAWWLHTGEEWTGEADMVLFGRPLRAARVHGPAALDALAERLREGREDAAVIELTLGPCPLTPAAAPEDDTPPHRNVAVRQLYRRLLGEPGSDIARLALHTAHAPCPAEPARVHVAHG